MPGSPTPHIFTPFQGPLVRARYVERPNRFLLRIGFDQEPEVHDAHLPDPGRLKELLLPDAELWVRPVPPSSTRRTRWTAVLVRSPDGELISMDTTLPNRLMGAALEAGALEEFSGFEMVRSEWPHGRSRFDFLLRHADGTQMVLEVKSVTLVRDRVALFPDAVTERGARHVAELADFAERPGWAASVLFVLQRSDAERIVAARDIDPRFSDTLADAAKRGVRVLGRRCAVTVEGVTLGDPVPAGPG